MATAQLGALVRQIQKLAAGPGACPWPDHQLLDAFSARRDQAAFAALVARHGRMVLRVCRRVLGHEQDAEDAFQATFLVLARNCGMIRHRQALAGWLHGVAYRTAMKAKRSAARRRNHEARLQARRTDLKSVPPSWDDVQAILDEEIERLADPYRAAFVLCVLEGKSWLEAAAEMGVKGGTVLSRVARARQMLQSRLTRRGIKLAVLLAALSVSDSAVSAAVPSFLANSTIRFGLLVAAGKSAAGVIPTHIAALAAGVTRAMFVTKAKIAVALILAVGLFAAGALAHQALAAKETATPAIQKSETPAPKDEATPKAGKDNNGDKDAVTFTGRVVDPDGKPAPGAKLHLIVDSWFKKPLHLQTTGGTDGGFRLSVGATESRPFADESTWSRTYIVATADGFGAAVSVPGELASVRDLTLRLAKDDVPIHGRILDLQGKPIAGVTVRVDALSIPSAGELTPWLQALEANPQDGYPIESRFLESVHLREATAIFTKVVTDADGRFQLKGIGRERLVALTLDAPTIVRDRVSVRTRPGKMIHASMFARNPEGGKLTYYGATFDHLAAPTRPIIGVVRDKDTGKPIPGITIQSDRFAGSNTSGDSSVRTVTDKDGKYRLVGMAKAAGNAIKAAPAPGQPYLQSAREVEDAPGLEPVTVNFDLKRGVLVTGRVLDKATGKPVFANVQYLAFADNPRHKKAPGWTAEHYLQTGDDGTFQLVAFPGRGLLTARGWSDHYRMAVGADKFPKKDRYGHQDEFLLTAPHLCHPTTVHTLVEINPPEDAEALTCDVVLDPGTMPRGSILGQDGKPLAGTKVFGLTAYGQSRMWTRTPLKSAEFTVYGLEAKDARQVVFIHADKHLAAALQVRGDAKERLTVRLEPWGIVTGRLVTNEGKPRSGVLLQIVDGLLLNNEHQTDKDGRFRIEGLVSGVKYALQAVLNGKSAGRVFAGLTIKAGETKDLGDIQVKPME